MLLGQRQHRSGDGLRGIGRRDHMHMPHRHSAVRLTMPIHRLTPELIGELNNGYPNLSDLNLADNGTRVYSPSPP